MMEVLFKVWMLIAVLPFLMAQKGLEMLAEHLGKESWTEILPEILVVVLSIAVIVLILLGY